MNKKLILIICLQFLFIIALFWVLIFYSKDEFETYQNDKIEEIETPSLVTNNGGLGIVSLSNNAQRNSGIKTAKVLSTSAQHFIKSSGNVLAIDGLIEARSTYLSLQLQKTLANAESGHNLTNYQRLKTLNADDKNVSDLVVEQALALVNADKAKISVLSIQLKNLQSSSQLQWGETLANAIFQEKPAAHLAKLFNKKNVLVQMSFPLDSPTPLLGTALKLTPANQEEVNLIADYVSPASSADINGFGKTFYYSAPAQSLRIGMRVNGEMPQTSRDNVFGLIIPNDAVVWYSGKSWAYFKKGQSQNGDDQFVRKPIVTDLEAAQGWFNQAINDANNEELEVVISGAQLLLSEEFKYLIKNENED